MQLEPNTAAKFQPERNNWWLRQGARNTRQYLERTVSLTVPYVTLFAHAHLAKDRFDFKLGHNWVATARAPEQSLPLPQPSLSQQQALVISAASS